MKAIIASDIHGSAFWCERLVKQIENENPDKIILLGDILYHGPRNPLPDGHDPMAVADMLNGYADRIVAVRGNCDAEVDQWVLEFPCLADYTVVCDGAQTLYCTHGHISSPENLPKLQPGTAFLSGHTHISKNYEENGIRIVNPGSVALPKDGHHSYAVYEDGTFEVRNLD